MTPDLPPDEDDRRESTDRYAIVEGLHLRQWALRCVVPLAALATNGAGVFAVAWLPSHDAPGLAASVEPVLRLCGAAAVLVAAVIRVLAKGVLVRKTTVTTGGIYRVVRHPFYLANLLGAVGVFLLAGSLGAIVAICWLAAALPLYVVTLRGEERGLTRLFPAQFAEYAARVPALVPRLRRADGPVVRVSWANLVAEREPPRLMRFLAGALLVFGLTLSTAAAGAVVTAAALGFGVSYAMGAAGRRGEPRTGDTPGA